MAAKTRSRVVEVHGKIPAILAKAGITLTLHELSRAKFRFYPEGWGDALAYGGHVDGYEIAEDLVRLFIRPIFVNNNEERCLTCYFGADATTTMWRFGAIKHSGLKRGFLELFV